MRDERLERILARAHLAGQAARNVERVAHHERCGQLDLRGPAAVAVPLGQQPDLAFVERRLGQDDAALRHLARLAVLGTCPER
jgi:hypothetical protein